MSLGTCMSNLKSVTFSVLEILAFNNKKIRGSVHMTLQRWSISVEQSAARNKAVLRRLKTEMYLYV